MDKRWVYKTEPKATDIEALSKSLNINPFLSKILIQRGIDSFDKAKTFFRPDIGTLHDPFLMKNMDKAVNRLTDAIFNHEKILLYGDYDVDGTTSVSLLYLFLKQFSDNLEFYVPDRYTEGYGISRKGIQYAAKENFDLIIALDVGIRANDRAKEAKAASIDLIICDHHLPGDEIPDALAVLDPKQVDCPYPFKELSGCGVGLKLLEGFCQQNTIEKTRLFEFLDLLAVSIASDIVPIVGENRVLAFYGVRKLNQSPTAGLKSLIEISGRKHPLTITDVVFAIGPRINAAGRIAHAKESVKLLIGDEDRELKDAKVLNERNVERKEHDQQITAEAIEMIDATPEEKHSTVLYKEDWHKGVVGIVASRCIEYRYRPTIILTESKGKATGSARSIHGFDIHEAISQCSDLLDNFGGHTHAAGMTLPIENISPFQERFEAIAKQEIPAELLIPKLEIDTELDLSFANFKSLSILNQMEPFGPHNLSPVFSTKGVTLKSRPKLLKEKHLKGFVYSGTKVGYEFIGFGLGHYFEHLEVGQPFSIAYHIETNEFLGNKTLILNIKDIQFDA